MILKSIYLLSVIVIPFLNVHSQQTIDLNKSYPDLPVTKSGGQTLKLNLKKDGIYKFSAQEQGVGIQMEILDSSGNQLSKSNEPNDLNDTQKMEFSPVNSGAYKLKINWFSHPQNSPGGKVNLIVKSLSDKEIQERIKIKKELEPENQKNVNTIDIDHFWIAFDNLKNCKTYSDSVNCIQHYYLDKATNGLIDFMQVRDITAENLIDAIKKNKASYESVRTFTFLTKKAEPIINEVFENFRKIYPGFKPFKVCFAIGIKNSGGTVSNQYVLIGAEVTTDTTGMANISDEKIIEKIKGIVAHECVHTQQKNILDSSAVECKLLSQCLLEGAADFIADLVVNKPRIYEYGDSHEKELWNEFKNEMCSDHYGNWLYNGYKKSDRPPDLGYYVGARIAHEYYNNASDKKQAVADIIEIKNPLRFLEMSRYDLKWR